MELSFKKRFRKIALVLALGFIALFVFRIIYGYTITLDGPTGQTHFFDSVSQAKKNYASKRYKVQSSNANKSAISVDQKYEKIAEISTKSSEFDQEEKQVRSEVEKYKALIQFEQKSGNKGHRKLNLLIGVPPENFDSLYQQLIHIGHVQAKRITKKDKTNEYKELNARKASLEKIRTSLIELKSKGGEIAEYIKLENRILEIEKQLQDLGVSLGDFDEENEFCTVRFSLLEGKEHKISFIHRVKVALEWTIKYYLGLLGITCLVFFITYLFLAIIDKLKLLDRSLNKRE